SAASTMPTTSLTFESVLILKAAPPRRVSARAYRAILIVIGIVLIFALALVKSNVWAHFWASPVILIYTILVTTFELSRVVGAIFYTEVTSRAVPNAATGTIPYEPSVSFVIPCKNEG